MTAALPTLPHPAAASGEIGGLLQTVAPVGPKLTIDAAADLFLNPQYARMLCLPVVTQDGTPVGTLSRHTLNGIFLRRFGRAAVMRVSAVAGAGCLTRLSPRALRRGGVGLRRDGSGQPRRDHRLRRVPRRTTGAGPSG